ncbi:MAG: amidohydrolase family protein [Salibacteraceae bacterium]
MRRITADYVFPLFRPPIANGVVVVDANDQILAVEAEGEGAPATERHSGVLCPGFVNTHCHLELSHLLGKVPKKTGLPGFIRDLNRVREAEEHEVKAAALAAEQHMLDQGIKAVGDISNGSVTFSIKAKSELTYHTFVELFGIAEARASATFENGQQLQKHYREIFASAHRQARVSIVPHAPYSLSKTLLQAIGAQEEKSPVSLHNQESDAETQFLRHKSGPFAEIFTGFGIDLSAWNAPGLRSLAAVLPHLNAQRPLLLVHNTFTEKEDIEVARQFSDQVFWCLCPNANQYIENRLPDVHLLRAEKLSITLGTDSLASNHQLSILSEMLTLQTHYPQLPLEEMLHWGCGNGALFLVLADQLGTLEKGKTPGINLITGVDLATMRLTEASKIKVLA